jgi:hypothetical protein
MGRGSDDLDVSHRASPVYEDLELDCAHDPAAAGGQGVTEPLLHSPAEPSEIGRVLDGDRRPWPGGGQEPSAVARARLASAPGTDARWPRSDTSAHAGTRASP